MQSSKCNDFFEKIKLSLMFAYVFLTNELNYEFVKVGMLVKSIFKYYLLLATYLFKMFN